VRRGVNIKLIKLLPNIRLTLVLKRK